MIGISSQLRPTTRGRLVQTHSFCTVLALCLAHAFFGIAAVFANDALLELTDDHVEIAQGFFGTGGRSVTPEFTKVVARVEAGEFGLDDILKLLKSRNQQRVAHALLSECVGDSRTITPIHLNGVLLGVFWNNAIVRDSVMLDLAKASEEFAGLEQDLEKEIADRGEFLTRFWKSVIVPETGTTKQERMVRLRRSQTRYANLMRFAFESLYDWPNHNLTEAEVKLKAMSPRRWREEATSEKQSEWEADYGNCRASMGFVVATVNLLSETEIRSKFERGLSPKSPVFRNPRR